MALNWLKSGPPKKVLVISAIGTFTGGIYLLRDTFRGTPFEKDVRCEGKVAIVTGGSSGIGKETARELARRGAIVYLLCRDKLRCDRARKDIIVSTKNKYVYARECDLGSLDSVRQFAERFRERETKVHILVNNAGVWRVPFGKTKDGFETHLGVNHMGHFFLTNLLLDLLKKGAPSRVINVSAEVHKKAKINKEDFNSEKKYSDYDAYNQSKLANILFTMELAERLKGTGVTANAVNPGTASTNLYKKSSGISGTFVDALAAPFMWIFFKTPVGAAQTVLYAALDPDLENVSGKYFGECKEQEVGEQAKDPATAKWLWAVSEKWTKLREFPRDESGNVTFS